VEVDVGAYGHESASSSWAAAIVPLAGTVDENIGDTNCDDAEKHIMSLRHMSGMHTLLHPLPHTLYQSRLHFWGD
jgi:hypothetical protein